jgi:hypothetical protein
MKATFITKRLLALGAALTAGILISHTAPASDTGGWKDNAISPVANPLFFESPLIQSELRPLFVYHKIADDFIGGFARVYALQARWAVNDRLAIIATKDGYIDLHPRVAVPRANGWADISAGIKYALIDDQEHQFILTPGVKFEIPLGARSVFQGNGYGEFDLFVSAMKGWDKFHVTACAGARIPVDFDSETASLHYGVQLDYSVCKYFIPFVTLNGHTVLSEGTGPAFGGIEGFDLINFGASDAGGASEVTLGCGLRSKILKNLDLGFAWEKAVTSPKGLFDERFTVDAVIHF